MPIDSSVIGRGFDPLPKPVDPLERQHNLGVQEAQQIGIEGKRREAAAEQRIQQLAQEYGEDPDAFVTALGREYPEKAFELAEKLSKTRKEGALAHQAQTKAERDKIESVLTLIQGATPENYATRRGLGIQIGGPIAAQLLPEQYDEAAITSAISIGRNANDYLKATEAAAERMSKGETREGVAELFANATTPEQWQVAQELTTKAGMTSMLPLFGAFSPEGVAKAKQMALSQKEQADITSKVVDDTRQDAAQRETGRHNRQMEARQPADPLVAIMGKDGKPVLVPRSQAVGQRPAGGTGGAGGGRGVTSGDANRMADFDTSLDDVATLRQTVGTIGSTGTRAAIGASLPNFITEATGYGTQAKQKQAVIDRVKQVIGKALEGGVLRKEDEYKYTKILPTISDPPAVVKTKLDGLDAAVTQRRERQLESLEDAGYNTSRYRARGEKTKDTGGKKADPLGIR